MIDRGALLLLPGPGAYRGTSRPALDADAARAPAPLRAVIDAYRTAIVEGDGVLEDLDEAIALRDRARAAGLADVELVVFEVPQPPPPGALPVAADAPSAGLRFAGWDVIEPLEPWWSRVRDAVEPLRRNAFGLLDDRAEAESLAASTTVADGDEPLTPARIWLAEP